LTPPPLLKIDRGASLSKTVPRVMPLVVVPRLAPLAPVLVFAVPALLTRLFSKVIVGRPLPVGGISSMRISERLLWVRFTVTSRSLRLTNPGSVMLTTAWLLVSSGLVGSGVTPGICAAPPPGSAASLTDPGLPATTAAVPPSVIRSETIRSIGVVAVDSVPESSQTTVTWPPGTPASPCP
jgi:hypothetical protein